MAQGSAGLGGWRPVAVWLVFQLTLTSIPGPELPELPSWRIDWLAHFCLYFGLGFLVARAAAAAGWRRGALLLAWLAITMLGVLDELHEKLIPGRGAEVMDWLMDTAGAACGLALATLLLRTRWAKWMR